MMNKSLFFCSITICFSACGHATSQTRGSEDRILSPIVYSGSASVTQGRAVTTLKDIFECEGGRPTNVGLISSSDGKEWVVPAHTNFQNKEFPEAPNLYNECEGDRFSNFQEALLKVKEGDVIEVDPAGALFTAYIFADNYFEMYINGVAVGKDKVPFTPFNSSIIRFRAIKPFTVAMKLVDWEENLGLGSEKNRGSEFHAGDGGVVAVFKDENGKVVAITDEQWKAQTFYTAPIKDLSCVSEVGQLRTSTHCDQSDREDGNNYFALHWQLPLDWEKDSFDDGDWPHATTYANETIGVDNKSAYTNFQEIFDDPANDAKFIWSSNVILDNEVIVRYVVK